MKFFLKKKRIPLSKKWRLNTILVLVAILIILSLNFFKKEVKNFFYLISSPVQKTFWQAGDKVSDFFEAILEIKNLKKENEELKLKIQELTSQIARLEELKKENQILREALDLGLEKEFKLTIAQVTAKEILEDSILINKGLEDGLRENLPVITQQKVIVGKISQVYKNFSKIILISNKKSSFDAKIVEKEIFGLVKGKGNSKVYLDLVPQDQELREGDLVVALGGIFPEGILVGEIKEIKKSDVEPFQQAEIKPYFDIKELRTIFIITNF